MATLPKQSKNVMQEFILNNLKSNNSLMQLSGAEWILLKKAEIIFPFLTKR